MRRTRYHRRMHLPSILPASVLLALAVLTAPVALASDGPAAACAPQFVDGWVRLAPTPRPMAAGYGKLVNACASPVAIVAVRSEDYAGVSLHQTSEVEGVSRMREVDSLPIAPGQSLQMQPGGLHLMLMQGKRALGEGDTVRIEFELADGSTVGGVLQARTP